MTNIKYNLSKPTPPAMPRLGKGTECVQLLLSQVSKDMHQPLVPMLFSILGAHVSGAEFMYPDLSWKETSGMLANIAAKSGVRKGKLSKKYSLCPDRQKPRMLRPSHLQKHHVFEVPTIPNILPGG